MRNVTLHLPNLLLFYIGRHTVLYFYSQYLDFICQVESQADQTTFLYTNRLAAIRCLVGVAGDRVNEGGAVKKDTPV